MVHANIASYKQQSKPNLIPIVRCLCETTMVVFHTSAYGSLYSF